MTTETPTPTPTTETTLRRGLVALAAAGIAGTALELAAIHHWETLAQLVPWVALAVIAGALAAAVARPTPATRRTARWTGLLLAVAGTYGVIDHVASNVSAGPLDAEYGARWDSMSTLAHWWAAANGGVGPAPVLAPAILAQIGACLWLATVGDRGPTSG